MSEQPNVTPDEIILKEGEAAHWELPPVQYPSMDMPEHPKAGEPIDGVRISCDGSLPMKIVGNSGIPEPTPGVPRIMIGLPILSYSHEFVQSFLKLWTEICNQPRGTMQVGYHFMYRRPVHMAEVELAETAIFNKCTHMLLMDDDIYDVTLTDLKKLVDADKDVIGGIMYASGFPYAMCAFRRYDADKKVIDMPSDNSMYRLYEIPCNCTKCGFGISHWDARFCPACGAEQDNIIQRVDLLPFACTLIKTSVFSKLKKPWFHCEIEYPSDSWFGDRLREADILQYAHMGVRLNHRGITDLTKPFYFNMELEKKRATAHPGLVNITQEEMNRHQYLLNRKLKEAELRCKTKVNFIDGKEEVINDSKTSSVPEDVREEAGAHVPG